MAILNNMQYEWEYYVSKFLIVMNYNEQVFF